jgi:hypothetical protein
MAAPFGYQKLAPTTATSLTIPNGAYSAVLTVETNSIRWRCDGTAPTSAEGNLIAAAAEREVDGPEGLSGLSIIDCSGASSVKVAYFPRVR